MPRMEGSASGLVNTVCNNRPLTAKAAPQSRAVTAEGMRDSHTMNETVGSASPPVRASHTSAGEKFTAPQKRLSRNNSPMTTGANTNRNSPFFRLMAGA